MADSLHSIVSTAGYKQLFNVWFKAIFVPYSSVFENFFVYIACRLWELAFQLGTKTSMAHLELRFKFSLKGKRDKNVLSRQHLDGLFQFSFFL